MFHYAYQFQVSAATQSLQSFFKYLCLTSHKISHFARFHMIALQIFQRHTVRGIVIETVDGLCSMESLQSMQFWLYLTLNFVGLLDL